MTAAPALHVVWSDEGGPLPDYAKHGRRAVRWAPWAPAIVLPHIPHHCAVCGYDGRPWISTGHLQPLPGETYTVRQRSEHNTDRRYGIERQVPAWPIGQLGLLHVGPAHAGMLPSRSTARSGSNSRPRTRGDGTRSVPLASGHS
jgi:hypothetical protein